MVQHLDMVRSVARITASKLPMRFEVEDLYQFGVMGLMQAAERWDPERGTPFNVFALRRVRGAMYDHVRVQNWRNHESLDEPLMTEHGAGGSETSPTEHRFQAAAQVRSCEQDVEDADGVEVRMRPVLAALQNLDPVARDVLLDHYFHDRSLKSMTSRLRVTKNRISQIHTQAIADLRAELLP